MKVLMWAHGDVEDTLEFPDNATEQDIQDAFQDLLGSIDSGWNVIEGEEPKSEPVVDDVALARKNIVAWLRSKCQPRSGAIKSTWERAAEAIERGDDLLVERS